LIVGMTLAVFVLAESCYRVQSTARDAIARIGSGGGDKAAAVPVHPVGSQPWYPEYAKEFAASEGSAWRQYVYFRRASAYHGRYINIDSLRHRVTPQPSTPAVPAARVFFFGGSTLWGSFLRDDHTIPAEASRRLQALVGPGSRVEVTNFGETGHVFTQGMLELMLQLREGNRPDVVVFYGGINETFSTLQNGEAGLGQNEANRVKEFALGRQLVWHGHEEGAVKDLHSFAVLNAEALSRLRLVQRVARVLHPAPPTTLLPRDSAARSIVRVYAENVRMIESLARTYGFTPIYVWQPTLHATRKVLTPFERRLMRTIDNDPMQRRLKEVHFAVLPLLDSAVTQQVPGRFVNASATFAGDTVSAYSDQVGHNTELAVPGIVDAFWPTLRTVVKAKLDAVPSPSSRPAPGIATAPVRARAGKL
jgi:lysophospholipase L1-like esterase